MAVRKGSPLNRPADPTPEEIEERAAWCRAQRNIHEQGRDERAGRVEWRLPHYAYDGRDCAFVAVET